jgi:DNA polymerase elongation subunit (family B)
MNSLQELSFFPFQWTYDQDFNDENITIKVYGWNKINEGVCLIVNNFTIPIWIELPDDIEWTEGKISMIKDKLNKLKGIWGKNAPVSIEFKRMQRLYFADVIKHKEQDKTIYNPKLFPFLQVNFKGTFAINTFMKVVAGLTFKDKVDINTIKESVINVNNLGNVKLRFHCYENSVSPILKLFAVQKLPSSSWITVKGKPVTNEDKITTKKYEYIVKYEHMNAMSEEKALTMPIVYPKVMSYDIECFSSKAPAFPKATNSEDVVFQFGATVCEQRKNKKYYKKYLLTLKDCDDIKDVDKDITEDEFVDVRCFRNEKELYLGFKDLIKETDPDVIIGYNIFRFDIVYVEDRNDTFYNIDYKDMGVTVAKRLAKLTSIKWESSAYGKQEMKYLDIEGRLMIDLFPYIERSFKLKNYKLDTVCKEFLKTTKDDVDASDIFSLYREGSSKSIAKIGKYCVQDTWVTLLLFEKLLIWFDLIESATTNGVPIFYLYTKGQQIKMYSQMLKYCYHNNIVIQSKVLEPKEGEEFSGAYVSDPVPGVYSMILPFDFASLYPSIIIAHNIDYSKLVTDDRIPDSDCHVFDWHDHKNCDHDPDIIEQKRKKKIRFDNAVEKLVKKGMDRREAENEIKSKEKTPKAKKVICGHFTYRFLKQEISGKGVVPTLIENLLKARKDTRKIIAKNEDKIKELEDQGETKEANRLKEVNMVLDKRQLAYKVSANSMYGAMGVKVGYLPFLPGAMCVTSKGRESIIKASAFLESDCKGKVIYNDTDSAYTYFPHLTGKSIEETWEYALSVVEKVKSLFPAPMKLEFEEKAYTKFLILTKKRYAAFATDLSRKEKLIKRGIVLTRRDNCDFLKKFYEKLMYNMLENADSYSKLPKNIYESPIIKEMLYYVINTVDSLFQRNYDIKDFIITKGMKQLKHKGKSDPVHIHVAKKMIKRGQPVEDGERIEYVLLDKGELKYTTTDKVTLKAEHASYFLDHSNILKIDFLTYLQRQCMNPIDELLGVGINLKGLIEEQFELRLQKKKYISALNNMFIQVTIC